MILYLLTSTIIFQNQALKCTNGCEKILLVIVNQKLSIKVLPFVSENLCTCSGHGGVQKDRVVPLAGILKLANQKKVGF